MSLKPSSEHFDSDPFIPLYIINHRKYILSSNIGRVYFSLSGYHFNPTDLSNFLGLEPTSVNAAGMHGRIDKPTISSWEISSEKVTGTIDFYELMRNITKELEPAKDKILTAIKNYNLSPRVTIELTLSVDKDEESPEVGFGARTTKLMAELGAFMNVDYKLTQRI